MKKYLIIFCLFFCLSGCSFAQLLREDENEEKLSAVGKKVNDSSLEETSYTYNEKDEIENYFGITLSDYEESHTNIIKTLIYEGELSTNEDNHFKFTVDKINTFFSNSSHISAPDIIKEFGKPTRISIYRNSRYNKDAMVSMTYESNSLYYSYEIGTQQITIPISIDIEWNIWQNENTKDRKIQGTPSDTPEYYRYNQDILNNGVFTPAVYEKDNAKEKNHD